MKTIPLNIWKIHPFFWQRYCTLPSDCDASIEPLMRFKWVLLLELLIGPDWDGCRSHTQNTYASLIFRQSEGEHVRVGGGGVMSKRRRGSKQRNERRRWKVSRQKENAERERQCRRVGGKGSWWRAVPVSKSSYYSSEGTAGRRLPPTPDETHAFIHVWRPRFGERFSLFLLSKPSDLIKCLQGNFNHLEAIAGGTLHFTIIIAVMNLSSWIHNRHFSF